MTIKRWLWGTGAFVAVVLLVYLPGTLLEPGHPSQFSLFLENLGRFMTVPSSHWPSYFLGAVSRHDHWFYFPVAFGLKTTLPFSLLTLALIVGGLLKKMTLPAWQWIPAVTVVVLTLPAPNIGVRYLLPAFPFVILMAADLIGIIWKWKAPSAPRSGKLLVGGFLLWHAVSVGANFPDLIGYFNDLIPEEKKVYYLGDSNLDLGQDVKKLALTAEQKGWTRVKLAQFGGTVDPSFYGLSWSPWTQKDLSGPQPGFVYAVNMALLQLGPAFRPELAPIAQSWILDRPPSGRVGNSWIYFEIPGEAQVDSSLAIPCVKIF